MFLKYSLASRKLNETSSRVDLQGSFLAKLINVWWVQGEAQSFNIFPSIIRCWAGGYYQFIVWGRRSYQDLGVSKFVRFIVTLPDFLHVRVQMWRPFHDYFLRGSSKSFFDQDFFVLVRSNYTDRCTAVMYWFHVNIDWAPDKEIRRNVQLVFKVFLMFSLAVFLFSIFPPIRESSTGISRILTVRWDFSISFLSLSQCWAYFIVWFYSLILRF